MATLSDDQIVYLKTQLGSSLDENDAQDRFDRLNDTRLVVKEVLEQRLADLISTPASFSVAGEYSQNTSENIKQLEAQIARVVAGGDDSFGLSVVKVSKPSRQLWR